MLWKVHVKPTLDCNLHCYYCNERRESAQMQLSTALQIISMLSSSDIQGDMDEIEFEWGGGEPLLLGIPFFREVFEAQERFFKCRVRNTIYTNLLLATSEFLDICRTANTKIYTSLDSLRNNVHRIGSADYFKELNHKLEEVVTRSIPTKLYMTVTAANVDEIIDVYHYCHRLGVNFDFSNVQTPYSLPLPKLAQLLPDPDKFASQAIRVFEEWYNDSRGICVVKPLYAVLEFLVGGTRPLPRILLSFDAQGQLYLCPFDISRGRAHSDLAKVVPDQLLKLAALPCTVAQPSNLGECSDCTFKQFCNLMHCKDTYTGTNPCGISIYALTCKYWRPVFNHVRQRIVESLAKIV
jgi:uncharacterized protein